MPIRLLQDMECSGKTVVIRQDLNVPMKDGRITNDKRIRAALPGIRMALDKGAGVVLLSHLGRPTEGVVEEKFSLAPVAAHLSGLLGRPVKLAADFDAAKAAPGEVVLLENIRFFKGEKKNDPELAAKLAALGDIYVMDAFGAAHRAHSSTEGAVRAAKVACAGPLMAADTRAKLPLCHEQGFMIPDDPQTLRPLVMELALGQGYDLILTSGGTGLAPRDTTPEALLPIFERRLPGFEQAMMQASLAKTPTAAISRAVAGTLGHTIAITLPGSRKAVSENLAAILPALGHALEKLHGDPSDCGK